MCDCTNLADLNARLGLEYGAATTLATRALLLTDPVHDALLRGKHRHAVRQFEQYRRDIGEQRAILARHRPHVPPEVRELLREMNPIIDDMLFIGSRLLDEGPSPEDPEVIRLEACFDRKLAELQAVIDAFERAGRAHFGREALHAPAIHGAERIMYYAIVISLLAAVAMVVGVRRLIMRPIQYLYAEVEQVDAGNYDRRIELQTNDEFSALAEAFNRLVDHIQNERLDAAAVQRRLLPEIPVCVPGAQLYADLIQSKEVGGDWYDVQEMEGKIWLAVGDASGSGMPAALISTLAITTMRLSGGSPEARLKATNDLLLRYMERSHSFATVILAVFDPVEGTMDFINCGHQEPLTYRRQAKEWSEKKCAGTLPLGVDHANFIPRAVSVKLQSGDRVLLYSDGLRDARDHERRFFGVQSIVFSLKANAGLSVEEQIAGLMRDVRGFAENNFVDDIACLLFEYTGRPPS